MITFSSKYRSKQTEIMDDMDFRGGEMEELLKDLKRVNSLLGGFGPTLSGIHELLGDRETDEKPLVILDLGCGDGELLRRCVDWAKRRNLTIKAIGVDANPFILEVAQKESLHYPNIEFQKIDVFSEMDSLPEFDIALSTLFLHHFANAKIVELLQRIGAKAKVGIVVNDLHRSPWAFQLFRWFSWIFLKTDTAKHDGLVSVARGFRKKELRNISNHIQGVHRIRWKWAFRYQWLIFNT